MALTPAQVEKLAEESRDFARFVKDPTISREKKVVALEAVSSKMKLSEITARFMGAPPLPPAHPSPRPVAAWRPPTQSGGGGLPAAHDPRRECHEVQFEIAILCTHWLPATFSRAAMLQGQARPLVGHAHRCVHAAALFRLSRIVDTFICI